MTENRELADAELESVVAGKAARSVGSRPATEGGSASHFTSPTPKAAPSGCPGGVCPLTRGGFLG